MVVAAAQRAWRRGHRRCAVRATNDAAEAAATTATMRATTTGTGMQQRAWISAWEERCGYRPLAARLASGLLRLASGRMRLTSGRMRCVCPMQEEPRAGSLTLSRIVSLAAPGPACLYATP